MQVRIQQLGPGMVQQIQTVCHDCQGQGERISAKDRCKQCQGRKVTRERKILEVHIEKGIGKKSYRKELVFLAIQLWLCVTCCLMQTSTRVALALSCLSASTSVPYRYERWTTDTIQW